MINVDEKIIRFGCGDVQVSGTWSAITFTGFKPPVEIGTAITDEVIKDKNIEYITEPIKIDFKTMEELMSFKRLVEDIDGITNTYFKYRDYVFDFSIYNQKSIEVILYHIERVRRHLTSFMAC